MIEIQPTEQLPQPQEPSPAFLEGLEEGMVIRRVYDLTHPEEEEQDATN